MARKKQLKILQVINCLKIGGAENVVKTLVQNSKNQMTLLVLYKKLNNQNEKELNKKGIKIYSLNNGKFLSLKTQIKIFKLIRKIKPDVIHTHLDGLVYIFFPAKLLGVKIINTVHSQLNNATLAKKIIYFIAYHSGVMVVAVSHALKTELQQIYKLKQVVCVSNGVNGDKFLKKIKRSEVRKKYGLPIKKMILINVGNLIQAKNQSQLIRSFSQLLKFQPNLFLLIVGSGTLENELIITAKNCGLKQNNFRIISNCSDPSSLLLASDYFILASTREGLPLVILEAFATKLPIISTPAGGIKDVISNKKNGYLISEVTSENILQGINFYANNKTKSRIVESAFNDFQQKYRAENMVSGYDDLYLKLSR